MRHHVEPTTDQVTSTNQVSPTAQITPDWTAALASGRGRVATLRALLLVLVAAAVLGIGAVQESTVRYSLVIGTIYAIAVLGNNAVNGALGEINLAAGAFMATGAYTMAWMLNHGHHVLVSFLAVLAFSAVAGAVLAVPVIRLGGIFTALATFALAYAVPDLALWMRDVTGGDSGVAVPSLTIGDTFVDGSSMTMLMIVSGVFLAAAGITLAVVRSRVGITLLVVGESTAAARVFGIRVTLVKIGVWTWASILGGVAGGFYALTVGYLNPTIFVVFLSISLFVGGLIGGTRNVAGAWIGGLVVGTLPTNIQNVVPASASGIVFGVILLLALLVGSGGLGGLLDRPAVRLARRSDRG